MALTVRGAFQIDGRALDAMDLAITITMTVGEWSRLVEHLVPAHPDSALKHVVRQAMSKINELRGAKWDLDG